MRTTYYWTLLVFLGLLASPATTRPAQAGEGGHRFLAADSSRGRVALIDAQGNTQWEMQIGPLHDLHLLDNGHVLLQTNWTQVVEVDPQSQRTVWQYDAAAANPGHKVEVHAFQRLADGRTMVAESGSSRIVEVDAEGHIVHSLPLQVAQPHPHRDTRLVRKLDNGHYLVCQEGEGIVREYSSAGHIVWEYAVPLFGRQPAAGHGPEAYGNQCFAALRLANGNTLISTGNGHRILEVTPEKQIVWQLQPADLPDMQLAWITSLQVLPNGNIVFVNCHAGPDNPQIVEITRDKKVVWTFRDFERFGNALTNVHIVASAGQSVSAEPGRDR